MKNNITMKSLVLFLLAATICSALSAADDKPLDPTDPFAKRVTPTPAPAAPSRWLSDSVLLTDLKSRQSTFTLLGVYQTGLKVKREDGEPYFLSWSEFRAEHFKRSYPIVAELLKRAPEAPGKPIPGGSINVAASWPRDFSAKDKERVLTITISLSTGEPSLVKIEPFAVSKYASPGKVNAVVLEKGKPIKLEIPFSSFGAKVPAEWVVRVWHENTLVKIAESSRDTASRIADAAKPVEPKRVYLQE